MDRQLAVFRQSVEIDQIASEITQQQHLRPHQTIAEAIERAQVSSGHWLSDAGQAIQSLNIDAERQIGRLKRTEIVQLARDIYSYWQQAIGNRQGAACLQYT